MSVAYAARPVKRYRRTNQELDVIDDAIVAALTEEHPATLRGVYYRVMSAGFVEKTEQAYQLIGRQLLKLRRSGRVPYWWITDGTRYVRRANTWESVDKMLRDAASSYRRMLWANQPVSVEIYTEKDAIVGVIDDACSEWDVPLGVLRGYASESFCWQVAVSLPADRPTYLYQLGDHDPSGVGAWENFADKVRAFAPDRDVRFERIAVTPQQIEDWDLPTRPTKKSDTRAKNFAGESVEVDAIRPSLLREIVSDAITQHIDPLELAHTRRAEQLERDTLQSMIDIGWPL